MNQTSPFPPETEVPLDPMIAQVLERLGTAPYVDLDALTEEDALSVARPALPVPPPPTGTIDHWIGTGDGASIRVRLYNCGAGDPPRAVLLHLHGGGFVSGSIELDDARCVWLAKEANCIIASVDYRLAPEHPFPTAAEDAFAAWQWLLHEAADFGGDARRCAISGSSAGGHIAIDVILLTRARGVQMPGFQLLTYPVVDPAIASASYDRFRNGPFLTRARMAWYWKQYRDGRVEDLSDLWAPLSADVAGFPAAHVITAEYDVLRDEGEAYVAKLRSAGIAASTHRHEKMIHGFVAMVPDHPETAVALRESAAALLRAFAEAKPKGE